MEQFCVQFQRQIFRHLSGNHHISGKQKTVHSFQEKNTLRSMPPILVTYFLTPILATNLRRTYDSLLFKSLTRCRRFRFGRLFAPHGHENRDLLMATTAKPIDADFDAATREPLLVAVTHSNVGSVNDNW